MLRIEGHSDDIVCVSGDGFGSDEISAGDRRVRLTIGHTEAVPGHDARGVVVEMEYGDNGSKTATWGATVRRIDEDIEIPWPVTITAPREGYSPIVVVDCPPDTPVVAELRRSVPEREYDHCGPWMPRWRFDGAKAEHVTG